MYMCFRRNSILNRYEISISNHWLRAMMARYSSYEVLLRTFPMLPRESRKVVRAVPSLEPSFEDLFDQRSVAWSFKPPMSLVPNTLLQWTNDEEASLFTRCAGISIIVSLGACFLEIGWRAVSRNDRAVSLFSNDTSCANEVFLGPKIWGKDFLSITLSVSDRPPSVCFGSRRGCVASR